jgi:hypothetical protein
MQDDRRVPLWLKSDPILPRSPYYAPAMTRSYFDTKAESLDSSKTLFLHSDKIRLCDLCTPTAHKCPGPAMSVMNLHPVWETMENVHICTIC